MDHVAVTFAQTRRPVLHGLQAKLTPLRFDGGALTTERRGVLWTVPRQFRAGHELLYILTFYLPRFLDQSLDEKLITVFHELFHISPRFNGDIRRHQGRYHVHTHSQKEYDREMLRLAHRYLQQQPDEGLWSFLRLDFAALTQTHGVVVGLKLPIPRLVPLPGRRTG
jgi:hypothetical protein